MRRICLLVAAAGLAVPLAIGACGGDKATTAEPTTTTSPQVTTQKQPSASQKQQPSGKPQASAKAKTRPQPMSPAATVRAYFAAINAKDYRTAWNLGGNNFDSSYEHFVAAFSDTEQDAVTILNVAGPVVTIKLTAVHTNGDVTTYEGTYTVRHGKLVDANIRETTPSAQPAPQATAKSFGDGVYRVGVDIQPGLYKATVTSGMGYWARLSGPDTANDVITNDVKERGTMYLRVRSTDKYIEIVGTTFTRVG
jgi:hypothetical protein